MSEQEQKPEQPRRMIEVDAEALYEVLNALNGPGHLVRELQATQGLEKVGLNIGRRNPINVLIDQWNAYAEQTLGQKPEEEKGSSNEQG
jgi:hypothetical protein